jgi:hypothetical protein
MAAKLIPLKYHVNTNYTIYVPNDGKNAAGIQELQAVSTRGQDKAVRK